VCLGELVGVFARRQAVGQAQNRDPDDADQSARIATAGSSDAGSSRRRRTRRFP
jgi:hypothetical protein